MSDEQTPYDAYGIQCGPGWQSLYQPILDLAQLYGIPIAQVKEKFGRLRIYTDGPDRRLSTLIAAAEAMSIHICEECGASAERGSTRTGWMRVLCPSCRTQMETT